jgi:hypothetical protein
MKKQLFAGIAAALIGTGAALDYMYPHSGDSQTAAAFIGGVTLSAAPTYSFGAELEFGTRIAGDNDYDPQRYRLWGAYNLGEIDLRVAGGITQYSFDGEDPEGYNLGVGVERNFSPRVTVRGEFIRDFMDDNFSAAVTTTRVAVLYNF